jgi:putative membrane protein
VTRVASHLPDTKQAAEPDAGAGGPGDGSEPDARFTFANERTFLAWNRTALALVVAGLAIAQLLPPFPGLPFGRHLLAVPLIA